MNQLMFLIPLLSLLIILLILPMIRALALKVNLTDIPNGRKVHRQPVPLVGGIAVFVAVSLALTFAMFHGFHLGEYVSIYLGATVLLIMGVADDKWDLGASLKLLIQLTLAHYIYLQGFYIDTLLGVFGIYAIPHWLEYALTIVVVAGVVNAFNLMDGIDGLAASIAIFTLAMLGAFAYMLNLFNIMLICMSIMGALVGFLYYNFSKTRKIFMGDAGSLVLGFVMVVLAIALLQKAEQAARPDIMYGGVFAVMALPVLDALRVFKNRIRRGKSPFAADKTHLHHLFLVTGLKHKYITLLIAALLVFITLMGVLTSSLTGVTFGIQIVLLVFSLTTRILKTKSDIQHWQVKIREMEQQGNL